MTDSCFRVLLCVTARDSSPRNFVKIIKKSSVTKKFVIGLLLCVTARDSSSRNFVKIIKKELGNKEIRYRAFVVHDRTGQFVTEFC